jgi:hypothetical protein
MAPMITQEERALREAVSPFLCEELLILDLDGTKTKKYYLVGENAIYLRDYQWDHCDIYRETDRGYFEACGEPIRRTVPAFTIGDMMALLPPFLLTKNSDHDFEASLDRWYNEIDVERDRRAPDVLARLVISMLKKGFLTAPMCNQMLSE